MHTNYEKIGIFLQIFTGNKKNDYLPNKTLPKANNTIGTSTVGIFQDIF